ncbi:PIN domain-containing protein [Haloarcula salinisoli]|uniref:Ribonuclease VapC n=1 Tax=Haloarcula salinisoli TaxID=2487746 RepID=A0A8J8CB78_9EURY|nr:PIN domain-containing protein [Halomicroarcula salinisoli]MBX0288263.1 PIN domain-containing protein [Halomicroarcula salinisoli]MBX0305924.1 PIN domain-containing protein [Halomicroarcula salinisoli]
MSDAYVFDTEAIIAFLYNEPGHERVGALLEELAATDREGYLSEANASEVYYLVARFEGTADEEPTAASLRTADRDLRTLTRNGLTLARADWRQIGEIKADGDISLADAAAVALAAERDATLIVGADDDFDSLPVAVDIERFRTEAV